MFMTFRIERSDTRNRYDDSCRSDKNITDCWIRDEGSCDTMIERNILCPKPKTFSHIQQPYRLLYVLSDFQATIAH